MSPATNHSPADRYLVERVLKGDTMAFKEIIKSTEGLVAQLIFKMVRNTNDHKDLVQEVYLRTFKGLAQFKFQSKLSTWIGQITYNTVLGYLEKKQLVLVDAGTEEEADTQEDRLDRIHQARYGAVNETEIQFSQKELAVFLQAGIEKLSPLYKTLITLYHQEEQSYAEIAQITSLPEGTVKSYLFRARKALKEHILSVYKKEDI